MTADARTSKPADAPSGGRIAGLDLIRGGAIALVLVKHAWPEEAGAAGIGGVVAFFALSGYLITGILRRDLSRYGRVRFGRFYRNRVLRLYPPLLLMLAVFTVVTSVADPLHDKSQLGWSLVLAALYLVDLPIPFGSRATMHLWTLATEEQFYLLWPWLLTIATRCRRLKTMFLIASSAIVVTLLVTFVVFANHMIRFYGLPTSWCIAMVIGAAAQIWGSPLARASVRTRKIAAIVGLALVFGCVAVPGDLENLYLYLLVGPVVAVGTVLIIDVVKEWQVLPARWLRPVLALGTISYAAYLWNFPISLWLGTERGSVPLVISLATIVLTIAVATISYWTLERPIMLFRQRLDREANTRLSVAAASEPPAR